MIVDARNINTGGGLVLLNELIDRAKRLGINLIVENKLLGQASCQEDESQAKLFFANLPPMLKRKKSAVYLHNPYLALTLFALIRRIFSGEAAFKYLLLAIYLRLFQFNTDVFIVQTKSMKSRVGLWLKQKIVILPFYESSNVEILSEGPKATDICAIGLPSKHKQYMPFLLAIEEILRRELPIKVELTIPENKANQALLRKVDQINHFAGTDIVTNHKLADYSKVVEIYQRSKALFFPSSFESLGLPLVEAAKFGLTVFAPKIDFVDEVIDNCVVVDAANEEHIAHIISQWLQGFITTEKAGLKLEDRGDDLLKGDWYE